MKKNTSKASVTYEHFFYDLILGARVFVSYGSRLEAFETRVNNFWRKKDLRYEFFVDEDRKLNPPLGTVYTTAHKSLRYSVWFEEKMPGLRTCDHEAMHLTQMVLDYLSIKLCDETDEVYCNVQEYFCSELFFGCRGSERREKVRCAWKVLEEVSKKLNR